MSDVNDAMLEAAERGFLPPNTHGTSSNDPEAETSIQVNNRFMREVTAASLDALEKANQQDPVLFIRAGKLAPLGLLYVAAASLALLRAFRRREAGTG